MSFKQFLQKYVRFEVWFLFLIIGLAVIFYFALSFYTNSISDPAEIGRSHIDVDSIEVSEGDNRFGIVPRPPKSNLNGRNLDRYAAIERPIAIVVENYTPIRDQQTGLDEAAIVYESLTEGGITRLLAIYSGEAVDSVGPVRSARPYFVDWAEEYRAAFLHVGGSPNALSKLRSSTNVLNIDEFAGSGTIWRNSQYFAPHNAYTSTENALEEMKTKEYDNIFDEPRFVFKDADETFGSIRVISIDYWTGPYLVKYAFDVEDGLWARYNGGKRHGNLKPANVIIQFTTQEVIDDELRRRIQTKGSGKSLVFRDGKVIEGTWQKDASINDKNQPLSSSFTKFFDEEGNEIELNRGQTWIEVVPYGRTVNYF